MAKDNSTNNPAAVQSGAANTTYVGGFVSLATGVTAIVTALIKAVKLPAHPTGAQAAVVDGAFFLAAVAVIGFAWVVTSDFRSRALTHSAAVKASPAAALSVKQKSTGDVYRVLGTHVTGSETKFLVNNEAGDKTFHWLNASDVELVPK